VENHASPSTIAADSATVRISRKTSGLSHYIVKRAEMNNNLEELEIRMATTLAPMLLTVSVFALSAASLVAKPQATIVDELLDVLAAFSIFAAALLVDSTLDKLSLSFTDRLRFLGGGFFAFSFVVGTMTTFVPILYLAKNHGNSAFGWEPRFIIFLFAGGSVFLKMMTLQEDKHIALAGMFLFFPLTIYLLAS
jgi:hypothetical protein